MISMDRTLLLKAGVDEVFTFLSDPYNIPQWNNGCKKVTRQGSSWHLDLESSRGYTVSVDKAWEVDASNYTITSRDLSGKGHYKFRLTARAADVTELHYHTEVSFGNGVTGKMGEKYFWKPRMEARLENNMNAILEIFGSAEAQEVS